MPEYAYKCLACEHTFSDVMPMKQYKKRAEPTTLGQLAERNTQKFGKYELDEKKRQHAKGKNVDKRGQPWYHKNGEASQNEVFKMTPEQKKRYIQEGKK